MNRLKQCRLNTGFSQQYVALTLGVKAPSVSNWESGKTKPTTENIAALARLYGVSVDYLLGNETGEQACSDRLEAAPLDQKRAEILSRLEGLPEDKLEDVLRYAEFVAQRK